MARLIILADEPWALADLLPASWRDEDWQPADGLDAPTRGLWAVLGRGAPGWALHAPGPSSPAGSWSRLVLVADAQGSLFDLLRGPLADSVRGLGSVACVARTGRRFHGHHGRDWQAADGNLHLSAASAVTLPAAAHPLSMSMLPAVSVLDAIAVATGGAVRPGIKWVNDIVVDDAKMGGVIASSRVLGTSMDMVVAGIGLNVAATPDVAPTPFVPAVTCLHACRGGGAGITLGALLWGTLDALARRIGRLHEEGAGSLRAEYVHHSVAIGRRVRVWKEQATANPDIRTWPWAFAAGRVAAIGDDLALRIDGREEPVSTGRLAFEETCRAFGL